MFRSDHSWSPCCTLIGRQRTWKKQRTIRMMWYQYWCLNSSTRTYIRVLDSIGPLQAGSPRAAGQRSSIPCSNEHWILVLPQISSATNAACNSDSNANTKYLVHIWYHDDRHEHWKRVAYPVFFVNDLLGLVLAPKRCRDQSQTFKEVNNNQPLTVGKKRVLFFWTSRFQVL